MLKSPPVIDLLILGERTITTTYGRVHSCTLCTLYVWPDIRKASGYIHIARDVRLYWMLPGFLKIVSKGCAQLLSGASGDEWNFRRNFRKSVEISRANSSISVAETFFHDAWIRVRLRRALEGMSFLTFQYWACKVRWSFNPTTICLQILKSTHNIVIEHHFTEDLYPNASYNRAEETVEIDQKPRPICLIKSRSLRASFLLERLSANILRPRYFHFFFVEAGFLQFRGYVSA